MGSINHDVEIVAEKGSKVSEAPSAEDTISTTNSSNFSGFKRFNARIEGLAGLEARGIERVPSDERQPASSAADLQVAILWFSANLSLNNLATGLFGPMVFGLGFLDSALLAVFGTILGSASTAYMATWGPQSGNRTMVSRLSEAIAIEPVRANISSIGHLALLYGILAGQVAYSLECRSHGRIYND